MKLKRLLILLIVILLTYLLTDYFKSLKSETEKTTENYTSMGNYYFKKQDYDTAIEYYKKAIELKHNRSQEIENTIDEISKKR